MHLNITKTTKRTENDFVKAIYSDSGNLVDIADITAKTPFDELLEKEEREGLYQQEEYRSAQVEVVGALLSYLLKDKEPLQICIRIFLLAYVINPDLIDGMTLKTIGETLGGISKQRISAKLKQQDKLIPYRGRNRKSTEQKATYSKSAKKAWIKRKSRKAA